MTLIIREMFPAFTVISALRVDEVVLVVAFTVTVVVPDEPDMGDTVHHEVLLEVADHDVFEVTVKVLLDAEELS